MGHTLLSVLGLFLLNTLLSGHAEGIDAILEISAFTLFEGDSVTLSCRRRSTPRYEMKATFFKDGSPLQMDKDHYSHNIRTVTIYPVSVSDTGIYKCQFDDGAESETRQLKVKARRRQVTLTADKTIIPLGGSVTLTCSVEDPAGFKYEWFRQTDTSGKASLQTVNRDDSHTVIKHGGRYTCRGWKREPYVITPESNAVTIQETVASLTLEPNWPQLFSGEMITLRCEIDEGGDTEWTYEWATTSSNTQSPTHSEYWINSATVYHSGEYRCKGRKDSYSSTEWSNAIRLNVSPYKPKPTLTAHNPIIPVGGTVTLTCSVWGSADWKYYWFKRTSDSSEAQPIRDGVPDRVIRVSQGGLYHCRGGRGDPLFFTEDSNKVNIQETDPNGASLTFEPKWPQIFSGETITLRCAIRGGRGTQWTYEWTTTSSNTQSTTHSEYRIISATESHSGEYRCKGRKDSYSSTEWSNAIRLNVSPNKPKPTLTAHKTIIPVTLTCYVWGSADWKFYWFKRTSDSSEAQPIRDGVPARDIRVSQGGLYHCRGGRGAPLFFTENSDKVNIQETVPNRASLTLQPNWPQIFSGEIFTLRCELDGGGDTQWTYEWRTSKSKTQSPTHSEYRIIRAQWSHSGIYRCKGRKDSYSSTEWSNAIRLNVSDKPQPVLTVSPLWLSPGDSVTLNCEVEHPSAGWRFYWYKTVPHLSSNYYSSELLPGSSNGTEQDSYIVHGQTHTAGYKCRAGRGDPVYYTDYSEHKFVWSGDFHPSASLTVSPDRVQHFTSDSVSVNCEGNSTEWRVRRLKENSYWSHCSSWGTMTGSTCNIYSYQQGDAVYWCESGSGEFSNAVNITIQKTDIILVSPVQPMTEGDYVSLSCRLRRQTFESNVFFYQNEKLIQNDTRRELNISAVSKSDEGFYKCQYSQQVSAQSWMSVNAVSRPEGSSSPVSLIVGLVCGIVLIILLLLLYRCRLSKGSWFIRSNQSESINQDSNTNHVVNQNEVQCNDYCSFLHGSEDTDNDAGGSQDVTYSSIELKNFGKKRSQHEPEERAIYSDVKTATADDNLMYAQVNHHDKGKAKRNKGKSPPAATADAVYSEVKPGTALGT